LSDKNILSANKCTGNTVADITDGGTSTKHSAYIRTGTYTGDGTISQAITGVGFQPKYVKIWPRQTVDDTDVIPVETTDTIVDDNASGGAIGAYSDGVNYSDAFFINTIISLDADGFTVDDGGGDYDPNKNERVYNYLALG
jgi:hypothetical protein